MQLLADTFCVCVFGLGEMAPHRGAVLCVWVVCVLLVICTASEHGLPAVHLSDVLSDALAVLPTRTLADLDDRYVVWVEHVCYVDVQLCPHFNQPVQLCLGHMSKV